MNMPTNNQPVTYKSLTFSGVSAFNIAKKFFMYTKGTSKIDRNINAIMKKMFSNQNIK